MSRNPTDDAAADVARLMRQVGVSELRRLIRLELARQKRERGRKRKRTRGQGRPSQFDTDLLLLAGCLQDAGSHHATPALRKATAALDYPRRGISQDAVIKRLRAKLKGRSLIEFTRDYLASQPPKRHQIVAVARWEEGRRGWRSIWSEYFSRAGTDAEKSDSK
jgi:hypothetical protein